MDTRIELNCGRRYGLVGFNGCGKSSLLACISEREVPIPEHKDIFTLCRETEESDKTALDCVMEVDGERARIEQEVTEPVGAGNSDSDRLMDLYDRLEELDASTAYALCVKPHILLLDEPTNHFDLVACVWLEEELKTYNRILVLVSHSQDFLNSVCTNIIHVHERKLKYYGGNYDSYVRTRAELEENQMCQTLSSGSE